MTTQRVLLSFFFFFFLGGLNSHVFKIGCSSKPLRSNQALNVSIKNPIKIDFSIYRLFDEIDFSIIKNLPGNSTVGNFGQLRADGQLHKIFEQVQNRFHWDKALGGRQFCHSGKTVTPYSLLLLKDPAGGFPLTVGSCPTLPYHPSLCGRLNKSGSMMLRAINFFALLCS